MKTERETYVELATAGLLVLTFLAFLARILPEGFAMLVGGVILLGSGVYQTSKGWPVSLITWILGLILFFAGLGLRLFLVSTIRINWVPIALLLVAAYFVWSWWHKRS